MASDMLTIDVSDDGVATLTMNRPDKRNAMCDALLQDIDGFFSQVPEGVKVAVLTGTAGHYCAGLDLSEHVARQIASNAPLSNYVMIQALSRIEDMDKAGGLFTESLCAALTHTSPDAVEGLQAFLQKRAPKFG